MLSKKMHLIRKESPESSELPVNCPVKYFHTAESDRFSTSAPSEASRSTAVTQGGRKEWREGGRERSLSLARAHPLRTAVVVQAATAATAAEKEEEEGKKERKKKKDRERMALAFLMGELLYLE